MQKPIRKIKSKNHKISMGTWAIGGGPAWGDRDKEESIQTIQRAVELGVNLLDTAPAYNFGNSEQIVGRALTGIKREEICLITKCGMFGIVKEVFLIRWVMFNYIKIYHLNLCEKK